MSSMRRDYVHIVPFNGMAMGKKKGGNRATNLLKRVNKLARDTKVISRELSKINPLLGSVASLAGYGKKKRKTTKKTTKKRKPAKKKVNKRAGSLLGKILGGITSLPAGALIGATAGLQQSIKGLGRSKRAGSRMTTRGIPARPLR